MGTETIKKPIYKRWWFWVLAVIFVPPIISVAMDPQASLDARKPVEPAMDAPHILSLTIDEAREELGAPTDSQPEADKNQLMVGVTEWENQFTVNGYDILLQFDIKSREVTDFFIVANDTENGTTNWKKYVQLAGLSEDSTDYTVTAVESRKNAGYYTGVDAKE